MELELTILMPCLNESETIGTCINKAQKWLSENHINGEILISDNGSTDGSQETALALGARVINVPQKGYGRALSWGIKAAHGKYIIMGDSDDSYDFSSLTPFIEKLREGYDLVMGNRFTGGIKKGAMPPLHQYLGNPLLSGIGKAFFHSDCSDFHCGLRGFNRESAVKMDLRTPGMEFASEMVIKATLLKMKICEVPTILYPDGRNRPPHLRSWSDGWRHLRFMLLYSPRWLFLYPGMLILLLGIIGFFGLATGPKKISGITFESNSLLIFSFAVIIGVQIILFSVYSKVYGMNEGYLPINKQLLQLLKLFRLETSIIIGAFLFLIGLSGLIVFIISWTSQGAGQLDTVSSIRQTIIWLMLIYFGLMFIFSGFFLSTLGIKKEYWAEQNDQI